MQQFDIHRTRAEQAGGCKQQAPLHRPPGLGTGRPEGPRPADPHSAPLPSSAASGQDPAAALLRDHDAQSRARGLEQSPNARLHARMREAELAIRRAESQVEYVLDLLRLRPDMSGWPSATERAAQFVRLQGIKTRLDDAAHRLMTERHTDEAVPQVSRGRSIAARSEEFRRESGQDY